MVQFALQGVRQAAPTLGETVVVIGLGLIGQITVQLLKANGCRVLGIDLDSGKCKMALELGADSACHPSEAEVTCEFLTKGRWADSVIITASTPSNQPIEQAGDLAKKKGRVCGGRFSWYADTQGQLLCQRARSITVYVVWARSL